MSARQRRQGTRMCVKNEVDKITPMLSGKQASDISQLKVSIAKLNKYHSDLAKADENVFSETEPKDIEAEIVNTAKYNDDLLDVVSRATVLVESVSSQATTASSSVSTSSSSGQRANLRLPKLELSPFSGDSLEWQSFWDRFESSVHNNTSLSTIDKLNYLQGLLIGDARDAVDGYRLTAANYDAVVETLKQRFGNKQMAIFAHFEAMLSLPQASHDTTKLQSVADQCERHIRSLVALGLDESTFGQVFTPIMLSKLPKHVKIELHRKNGSQTWSLSHLREWLKDEIRARELGERAFGDSQGAGKNSGGSDSKSDVKPKSGNHNQSKPKESEVKAPTSASALVSNASGRDISCAYCGQDHFSDKCEKYPDVVSRKPKVLSRCFCCLGKGHQAKECTKKVPCVYCKKSGHHRSLCYTKFGGPGPSASKSKAEQGLNVDVKPFVPSGGVPVSEPNNKRSIMQTAVSNIVNEVMQSVVPARLLFDTAASRSFITEQKFNELKLPVVGSELVSVAGFQSCKRKTEKYKIVQLAVQCLDGSLQVITASVVPSITCPIQKIPIDPSQFPIVNNIVLAEPLITQPEFVVVDLLVGLDHYYDFVASDRIECPGGLILLSSRLGYISTGRVATETTGPDTIAVMLLNNGPTLSEPPNHHVSIERYWDLEDIGMKEPPKQLSGDDEALAFHSSTLKRGDDGRYYSKWPWKCENPDLPDNFEIAYGRLLSLFKRLSRSPEVFQSYQQVIDDQMKKGIIEQAPLETNNVVYYMPHHCVITPSKATTKLRVVYDASSKSRKDVLSLNDCLHRGPVMLEDLCGLLMRFRLNHIALVSDIEKAFLQIGLQDEDRDVTRFLWVVNPALPPVDSNLLILRFCRVPFGVKSSPFVLGNTVCQHLVREATPVADKIRRNHFVDNVITGEQTVSVAIEHYKESKALFQSARMNLREWYTNSPEVRSAFAEADKGVDSEPKVLGLRWNCETDTLRVEPVKGSRDQMVTKRNILKTVAQVFDPLGFYTPVTVQGKLLVQELWKSNLGWDDAVPNDVAEKWSKVLSSLEAIPVSGIPRFVGNTLSTRFELHVFCDASIKACGAAVYLLTRGDSCVSCDLMFAKSRLAPIKSPLTIPRLELVAAVIGIRLLAFAESELRLQSVEKFLWTDSQCTLHWIKRVNVSARFVENRVTEIRKHADVSFQFVPSEDNPADLPSRGCDVSTLQAASLWWHGPAWLNDRGSWPVFQSSSRLASMESVSEDDVIVVDSDQLVQPIDETKFSSLSRLLRSTSYVLRFINNIKPNSNRLLGFLSVKELRQSVTFWHRLVQLKSFPELVNFKGATWPKGIGRQLNLFKDSDGILRCAGRIQEATGLSYDAKYPVLLPKSGHFTDLLVMDCHKRLIHAGVAETLAQLRQQHWIIHGRATVKRVRKSCLLCRHKEGGPFQIPPAPPLPQSRVSEFPAFANTGLDYLGPLWVKRFDGSKQKVWVCLYTCMVVRAVYLDVVEDLSAESFLLSLRRFIASHGTPTLIMSDNASQFHASQKALQRMWRQLFESEPVQTYACHHGIQWDFVVEFAPWMGGFYERLVGEVKRSLKKALDRILASPSQLMTILYEIAAVINSRPLVYSEDEVGSFPLTPAHFLAKGKKPGLPTFSAGEDEYLPKPNRADGLIDNWKRLQAVTEQFWYIWRQQYLVSLRERYSGQKQRNCSSLRPVVNSVVQVKDNLPRGLWKLGTIKELHVSRDGYARSATVRLVSGKCIRRPLKLLYPIEVGSDDSNFEPHNSDRVPVVAGVQRPSRSAATIAQRKWKQQL